MSFKNVKVALVLFMAGAAVISCSEDEAELMAQVRVNGTVLIDNDDDYNGDVGGDFMGDGGSETRTFAWTNALRTADYNADITGSKGGSFRMVIKDAEGLVVLDKSLTAGVEPDSFDGVTAVGPAGVWTVTITLTTFNGEGSFSISEGN